MQSFVCLCGNRVFFENTQCVSCARELGWCPVCRRIAALVAGEGGALRCGGEACGARLVKCHNYAVERVCNRCCPAPEDPSTPLPLCDCCRFNATIPDLSVAGNREKWARLESAKRRLLYTLDLLRLPYGSAQDGVVPPLSFAFEADVSHEGQERWAMGDEERVYTGHVEGRITINLLEADAVEREKARVRFAEAHRTVIGHFRHEIGHYYWAMLVRGRCEPAFVDVFGDHHGLAYPEAQRRYYETGPPAGWPSRYVSAYAAMHPWEDFAETFANYLDMVSVLDTSLHTGVGDLDPARAELPAMIERYVGLGVVLNEMNRAMGLPDLVPEVFNAAVESKLAFVHDLLHGARVPARN